MRRTGRVAAVTLAALLGFSGIPFTHSVAAAGGGFTAEDLTLQPGSDTTQININWYADTGTTDARVRFHSGSSDLTTLATETGATTGKVACKATVTGLSLNTSYQYEVSNDGGSTWSQDYTYVTPAEGAFSFAFVGDPQLNHGNEDTTSNAYSSDHTTKQGWLDTVNAIVGKDVNFIASAGDQIDDTSGGSEAQYTDFFAPTGLTSIPFAAAVGNHDRNTGFLYHYNLPNEQNVDSIVNTTTTAAATEVTTAKGNYYYSYNNALFIVLNDSSYPASVEQAAPYIAAFRQTIAAAIAAFPDSTWIFVQHHKSTASVAQHVADTDIEYYVEAGFEDLMDEFHVDFVLGGHDHVYARSYVMKDGKRTSENAASYVDPDGTIYITANTASGIKYYNIFDSAKLYVKDNVSYPLLANGLSGSVEYLKGVYPLSTAVAGQTKVPGYSIVNVDGNQVTFQTYSTYDNSSTTTVDESVVSADTFTVTKNVEADTKSQGYDNVTADLSATLEARYESFTSDAAGGTTEIVEYNTDNLCAYAVNGDTGSLVKIDLSQVDKDGTGVETPTAVHIPIRDIVSANVAGFTYGDMTSVAISTKEDFLAVAIQSSDYATNGILAIFDYDGNFIRYYETGVQPDMVTIDDETSQILVANEGEPRMGTGGVDPAGSVTLIAIGSATSGTYDFTGFDAERQALTDAGVVIRKGVNPSTDFEPEYITVASGVAYISLQENNAIAVLNLTSRTFTGIYSLGVEDFTKTAIDLGNDDGTYLATTYSNLYGLRMADGISSYQVDGITYLVTANEGDSRADWTGLDNEIKSKTSPVGDITTAKKVTYFNASLYDGVDTGKNYIFGGRSFTIFKVTTEGISQVYSSTNEFESLTAEKLADYFNCSNDNITKEDRSGKKGVEAENVTIGAIDGHTYAYIGLERIGGIMIYDITNPANATYVNYINSRDFSSAIAGDDSPEGLAFVEGGPTPMILAAFEVSGTVAAYSLTMNYADYSDLDQALALVPSDLSKYTEESASQLTSTIEILNRRLLRSEQSQVDSLTASILLDVSSLELISTDDGNTDDGNTDDGNTDDGNTDDGNTDDGATDDGNTDDGSTDDGNTDDGATDDGSTDTPTFDQIEVMIHEYWMVLCVALLTMGLIGIKLRKEQDQE